MEGGVSSGGTDSAVQTKLSAPSAEERELNLQNRNYIPANIRNGILYYKLNGNPKAKNKLFLIAGVGGIGIVFDNLIANILSDEEWKDNVEICCFDNRGVGQSTDPSDRYTTTAMAKDCLDLINHLDWKQTHVLGQSMGGMVAQELAWLAPTRIATLTLTCTVSSGFLASPFSGTRTILANVFEKNPEKKLHRVMMLLFQKEVYDNPDSDKYRRLLDGVISRYTTYGEGPNSTSIALGQVSAVQTHSVCSARLKQIAECGFPIQCIIPTEDKLCAITKQHKLARGLGVEPVIVPAGHGILWENPQELARLLGEHMQRAPTSVI
eukprot:m.844935 g.844935  ORF g.844935 m.844935 type:complete len:323 (+) comp23476_c0_seq7:243-1211(+)